MHYFTFLNYNYRPDITSHRLFHRRKPLRHRSKHRKSGPAVSVHPPSHVVVSTECIRHLMWEAVTYVPAQQHNYY